MAVRQNGDRAGKPTGERRERYPKTNRPETNTRGLSGSRPLADGGHGREVCGSDAIDTEPASLRWTVVRTHTTTSPCESSVRRHTSRQYQESSRDSQSGRHDWTTDGSFEDPRFSNHKPAVTPIPGMGIRSCRVSKSTVSGTKGIRSDVAWSKSRYYPFIAAAGPPRRGRAQVSMKHNTPGDPILWTDRQLSTPSPPPAIRDFWCTNKTPCASSTP